MKAVNPQGIKLDTDTGTISCVKCGAVIATREEAGSDEAGPDKAFEIAEKIRTHVAERCGVGRN